MTVEVLLVTHPGIGTAMLNIATRIMGECGLPIRCLEVPPDAELEPIIAVTRAQLERRAACNGDGVLLLTDLFGSTPHNVAQGLQPDTAHRVVSGLNLSMLVRVFNYPADDLETLVAKAIEGGWRGIQADRREEA